MFINPKDLIPLPINQFQVDGTFYVKVKEDDFARMTLSKEEIQNPRTWAKTMEHYTNGNLFIAREKPWKPISL